MDNSTLNILAKIRIFALRNFLHTHIFSIGIIFQLILFMIQIILVIFVSGKLTFLLLIFPILICCISLVVNYVGKKIDEELDNFEDDLQFNITGKVTYKLFNRMIEDLDRKKYHIGTELDENGCIKAWSIYNKDMSTEEYFSAENKPLLTSKENNIVDLLKFIKEQKNV